LPTVIEPEVFKKEIPFSVRVGTSFVTVFMLT